MGKHEYSLNHEELHGQPGLEVVQVYKHSDLQVVPDSFRDQSRDPAPSYYEDPKAGTPKDSVIDTPKTRRIWLWVLLGCLSLLVIAGAVVGGILGSRAARASSTGGPQRTEDGTPTTSLDPAPSATDTGEPEKPESIRQGSTLSVTGWRKSNGAEILLFYQGPDDKARFSRYDSNRASFAVNDSYWDLPNMFTAAADESTQLSGTMIVYGTSYLPQTELFYTSGGRLLGVNFNDKLTPSFGTDSINDMNITTGLDSSIAAYWPWITFQNAEGELCEVRNRLIGSRFSPAAQWDVKSLGLKALKGTRLATVPLFTSFSKLAVLGGYGIFYQKDNGQLAAFVPGLGDDDLDEDYAQSWPTVLPSISFPKHNAFAAFSVARASDSSNRVDTYVLFVDKSSNINVLYIDSSSVWKTTQPVALRSADADTDITCLTMATTDAGASGTEVVLEEPSSESRCYFQRDGRVEEVMLRGTEWVRVESVPIP